MCGVKTLALCSVILLSGCAIAPRPSHWAPQVQTRTNGCPDLGGSYSNHGVESDGKKSGPLAALVFAEAARNWTTSDVKAREKFATASHLTFAGPDKNGLKIEAWKETELLGVIERHANLGDGIRCDRGALLVSLPVHAAAGGGVFFDTLREAAITRTIDGSLVVNSSSMGVGLGFYMIPLAMYFESWAIYRAATPTGMERGSK